MTRPDSDPGFRVAVRGYDRQQVDTYRSRAETELASARAERDSAARAHARTTEQLETVQAELRRLRGQLTNSPTALSERLREILHLASQDADQTRADARTEADQTRAQAEADAQAALKQARETAAGIVDRARAEQQQSRAEIAQAQATARKQFDDARAEAQRERERADADAAARRSEAERHAREQREQAQAAADARLAGLSRELTDLTRHRDEVLASLRGIYDTLTTIVERPADDQVTDVPVATSTNHAPPGVRAIG